MSNNTKISPYKVFGTNSDLEKNGVELDFGFCKVIVARQGGHNKKWNKVWREISRPYKSLIMRGELPEETDAKIMAEAYADAIILGWSDMYDAHGNVLEFTRDNVIKVLLDLPDFFDEIIRRATNFQNFQKEDEEEEGKNS